MANNNALINKLLTELIEKNAEFDNLSVSADSKTISHHDPKALLELAKELRKDAQPVQRFVMKPK